MPSRGFMEDCLKQIFERELKDARIARRSDAPERRRRARPTGHGSSTESFRKVEVHIVEEVEEFRPELESLAFCERNIL
jgi:hypothetical protein